LSKSPNKTQPTTTSAADFIATIENQRRREDAQILLSLFHRVTGYEPQMWGSSIIGYGRYHYSYESGRQGDFLVTGFSPRKAALSVYIMPGYRDLSEKLSRLGKHKIGKSCLYINKLSDIDLTVLEEIVRDGVTYMKSKYEVWEK
tara:strand:+ start:127675 stop:128109 length:435 start_codon:yes stop_codon:yes gene_type:complete